jgi:hypothetical protein
MVPVTEPMAMPGVTMSVSTVGPIRLREGRISQNQNPNCSDHHHHLGSA